MCKKILFCISIVLSICYFTSCIHLSNDNITIHEANDSTAKNEQELFENEVKEILFVDKSHQNSVVSIAYPHFLQHDMQDINQNIVEFVSNIAVQIYGNSYEDLQLEMTYKITRYDSSYLSIVFEGLGDVATSAYPNNIYVTRTFELKTNSVVKLTDVFSLDLNFAQIVYNSVIEQCTKDLSEVFKVEYKDTECLLNILESCDEFNENGVSCWSNFTELGIVISIPILHIGGDHLEIMIPYEECTGDGSLCSMIKIK